MPKTSFSKSLFALSCFGLLALSPVLLTGCRSGNSKDKAEKKEAVVSMQVTQVDQLPALGEKIPDGQYLVAKVHFENLANKTLEMSSSDFMLQNITEDEKERYSQPAEKNLLREFKKTYGEALQDKLVESTTINLYPRMELERYFIFMVPSNAKIDGYQITYEPEKVSTPLVVTGTTVINDHRNATELPPTEE